MTTAGQMTLSLAPSCKVHGCAEATVGSSVRGEGHVCARHNNIEWATALARQRNDEAWRAFGRRWLAELEGAA